MKAYYIHQGANMDTQKLKYFIAVAEQLNFSEAAIKVGVSQSAISQQIAELEKQVGTSLIDRKTRPLQLTAAGKVLLRESYSLASRTEEALNKAYLATLGHYGYLKVGFLGGVERGFLPQAIREFRQAYPNIELSLHQYNWGELNKALMRDEIDVGFTMSYGLERFTDLESKVLFSDVIGVVMHKSHPLANETSIKLSSLKDETFVTLNPKTDFLLYDQTLHLCNAFGFVPSKVTFCWSVDAVLFNIESGLGICVITGTIRNLTSPDVKMIELDHPDKFFNVNVAWNKTSSNAAIPIFVNRLESLRQIKQLNENSLIEKKVIV
jgi:DNA-binding transcriptional LysR family regulator